MEHQVRQGRIGIVPNIVIVNTYTSVASAYSVCFTIFFYFVVKNQFLFVVHFTALIGVILNYFFVKRTRNFELGAYILLSMGTAIMLCLFATGGWENTGIIWPFAYLPAAFFMNRGKGGRTIVFILFTGCLVLTALHFFNVILLPYTPVTLFNFFAALLVFTILMIIYQNATINYESFLAYTRDLFETSLDPIVIVDDNCKVSDLNQIAEKITGMTFEKLLGADFSLYFTEPEKFKEVCKRALLEGKLQNIPMSVKNHVHRTDTDVFVNATISWSEKTKLKRIFIVMRDVTEQKESERKRTELLNELEIANKELESFSYSVSHDLRTPLRTINGFTQILEKKYKEKIDEDGRRMMKTVTDEARRMGQLIDDLLAFSRLGNKEVQKSLVDTTALVRGIFDDFQKGELVNKNITVKNLLPAYGDGALLHQVFLNLISNALKYSGTKPNPVIEVGSYDSGDEIVYYVKDNGAGFNMEYYDKLFNVFQRLHRQDEFEGTGVGLAIVNRIVSRHGGKVWAEGKVNEGAIFSFSLPKF